MRLLITLTLMINALSLSPTGNSQTPGKTSSSTFFIQCMIEMETEEQTALLQRELNSNPYVKICRLDKKSKTALIITKDIDVINAEVIRSWFGEYDSKITCLNTGVYAVDKMQDFPLTNCK